VGRYGNHALGAVIAKGPCRATERSSCVNHIIDNDAVFARNIADEIHHFAYVCAFAAFVDDCEPSIQALRVRPRALYAASVRRNEHRGRIKVLAQVVFEHHGHRVQVVEGDVEKTLDLAGMKIERQHPSHPGGLNQVCGELCGDRSSRRNLAVLPAVTVVRKDSGNRPCGRAPKRIGEDQQLHDMVVHGAARRLDDERVNPANILIQLDKRLPVRKLRDARFGERRLKIGSDGRGKHRIRSASKDANLLQHGDLLKDLLVIAPRDQGVNARRCEGLRTNTLCCPAKACHKEAVQPRYFVRPAIGNHLRGGHPWLFRDSITEQRGKPLAGESVLIDDGSLVGIAVADPESPIAARMWSTKDDVIDARLIGARLRQAVALRARLFDERTTAYRLVHGEGDRMPGLVIDRYAGVAIVKADGAGAEALFRKFAGTIQEVLVESGIETAVYRKRDGEQETLFGPAAPARIAVREHGIAFWVDLAKGQKTGAFLDQRENRKRVGQFARGLRVLNLFSYAGGFSLSAARGGATEVTSVDIAALGHRTAEESFRLEGVDPAQHRFVTSDVFDFLQRERQRRQTWDVVISDPPSFAPNEKSRLRALSAYRKLHQAAVAVLAPSGILCAASCSSHVDAESFLATLDDQTLQHGGLRLTSFFGPPEDHPTIPTFPEGRYLKFAVLQ
jgi:23S rRNA (cytosine1962-C5)-methyltransferase